jgi:hypothetical protein
LQPLTTVLSVSPQVLSPLLADRPLRGKPINHRYVNPDILS